MNEAAQLHPLLVSQQNVLLDHVDRLLSVI
jgi:hypothetical protein